MSTQDAATAVFQQSTALLEGSQWMQITSGRFYSWLMTGLILLWISALVVACYKPAENRKAQLTVDLTVLASSSLLLVASSPVWACCMSLAGIVWTRVPGGPLSTPVQLPSFANFISTMKTHDRIEAKFRIPDPNADQTDEPDRCLICWETNNPFKLPCNHFACQDCLTGMAATRKSQCPYCQRALFRDDRDLLLSSIWNASLACMVVTAFLHLITTGLLINKHQFISLLWPGSQMIAMIGLSVAWTYLVRHHGPLWWHVLNRNPVATVVPRELVALAYFGHFLYNMHRAAQQMLKEDWVLVYP